MIYILTFSFIILDLVTGLINGFMKKEFTSSIMRQGLFHKCGSVLTVLLGVLADYTQKWLDIGVNIPITKSICIYIILMEIGSIIENISQINPQILPDKLKSYFKKLRSD